MDTNDYAELAVLRAEQVGGISISPMVRAALIKHVGVTIRGMLSAMGKDTPAPGGGEGEVTVEATRDRLAAAILRGEGEKPTPAPATGLREAAKAAEVMLRGARPRLIATGADMGIYDAALAELQAVLAAPAEGVVVRRETAEAMREWRAQMSREAHLRLNQAIDADPALAPTPPATEVQP